MHACTVFANIVFFGVMTPAGSRKVHRKSQSGKQGQQTPEGLVSHRRQEDYEGLSQPAETAYSTYPHFK